MNNDKPLFTETECFSDAAMQIDAEAARALRPIIKKFLNEGYNIRELCHIIIHNVAAIEAEFVLCGQYRAQREKKSE